MPTILQKEKSQSVKSIDDVSSELNDNVTIKGMKELFDVTDKNIDIKTELESREIRQILRLAFMGKEFQIKSMQKFLTQFMRLRLSKERQSRKELIDMVKADLTNELQLAQGNKHMLKGLMGRG